MTDYKKRYQAMYGVQKSHRKRKWDTLATLGMLDKRMRDLVLPARKFVLPTAREMLDFRTPSLKLRSPYLGRQYRYLSGARRDEGLKVFSQEQVAAEFPERSTILKRQYKIRASDADSEYPELLEYKKNVLAAANTSGPHQPRDNNLLEAKPKQPLEAEPKRPKWEELYESAMMKTSTAESIDREAALLEAKLEALQVTKKETWNRRTVVLETETKWDVDEAFTELSSEAEEAVDAVLSSDDRDEVLVLHKNSNIEITGSIIQCLQQQTWLNDEVINLYLELLKERELREPKRFLKCHFFNTFFYNKLFKDKGSYDFKAVRRWTTQKKLGYGLLECDKIIVPVHKDIHWCLAVINLRDKKLEYLDSLGGVDENVLEVLARYIVDEGKDKSGEVPDIETWEKCYPDDIPEQQNGCDCGMFMLKYADFHSRGVSLSFSQKDMQYFRRRTVWEILSLRAN